MYRQDQKEPALDWLLPYEYTPYYTAVIKTAHLLVIHHTFLESQQDIEMTIKERSMSQEDAEAVVPGVFRLVRDQVAGFMTPLTPASQPTPMN